MLYSNVQGFNNDSGLIYKTYNGLSQYKLKNNIYPSYSTPQAKYINEKNEKTLLETMNDDVSDMVNKNGKKKIKDISNSELQDGGFKNKGDVSKQTKPNRLTISKKARILASGAVDELPTEKSREARGTKETMSKFQSFLNSIKQDKSRDIKPESNRAKTQY